MTTKLITSLDELEPGMKTKDGWRFDAFPEGSDWVHRCSWFRGDTRVVEAELWVGEVEELFLNQEVEVPRMKLRCMRDMQRESAYLKEPCGEVHEVPTWDGECAYCPVCNESTPHIEVPE